jgi:fimbrial chaperone protein
LALQGLAAVVALALLCRPAEGRAQGIRGFTVIPVTMEMAPGERARTLTIQNNTDSKASFQVRPFAWSQAGGPDQLDVTDGLVVSPPIGELAPGATQVVRLVLRSAAPTNREIAYRILLDQIPSASASDQIGFVLRLSIPVFVEPPGKIAPQLGWTVEVQGQDAWLVARNEGSRRQVLRDMKLMAGGGALALESNVSPYVIAGGVRRWRIVGRSLAPAADATLRLTAHADTGEIDQAVPVRRDSP